MPLPIVAIAGRALVGKAAKKFSSRVAKGVATSMARKSKKGAKRSFAKGIGSAMKAGTSFDLGKTPRAQAQRSVTTVEETQKQAPQRRDRGLPAAVPMTPLNTPDKTSEILLLSQNVMKLEKEDNFDVETSIGRKNKIKQQDFRNTAMYLLEQLVENSYDTAKHVSEIAGAGAGIAGKGVKAGANLGASFVGNTLKTTKTVVVSTAKTVSFLSSWLLKAIPAALSAFVIGGVFGPSVVDFIGTYMASKGADISEGIGDYFMTGFASDLGDLFNDLVIDLLRFFQDVTNNITDLGEDIYDKVKLQMAEWWNDTVADAVGYKGVDMSDSPWPLNKLGKNFGAFEIPLHIDTNTMKIEMAGKEEERAHRDAAIENSRFKNDVFDEKQKQIRKKEDQEALDRGEKIGFGKAIQDVGEAYDVAKDVGTQITTVVGGAAKYAAGAVGNKIGQGLDAAGRSLTEAGFYTKTDKEAEVVDKSKAIPNTESSMIVSPGVDMNNLDPEMKQYIEDLSKDYFEMYGEKFQINSGYRSLSKQKELHSKLGPGKAAKPGHSMHNYGVAVDAQSQQIKKAEEAGLLDKHNLQRTYSGGMHIEKKGVDRKATRESGNIVENKSAEIVTTNRSIAGAVFKAEETIKSDAYMHQINSDIGSLNKQISEMKSDIGIMQSSTIRKYNIGNR